MKKMFKSKVSKLIILSVLVISLLSLLIVNIIASQTPDPGSNEDPIVTKSYVDAKIEEAISNLSNTDITNPGDTQDDSSSSDNTDVSYSDKDLEDLQNQITMLEEKLSDFMYVQNLEILNLHSKIQNYESDKFTVVQLYTGQKIMLGEGTELILRAGQATAISSEGGDLTDISAGQNLLGGSSIKTNHLLIASRDDGRGIKAVSDVVWTLVKGDYQVVN